MLSNNGVRNKSAHVIMIPETILDTIDLVDISFVRESSDPPLPILRIDSSSLMSKHIFSTMSEKLDIYNVYFQDETNIT